jgi:3',5'-cyclic AMP phosphodiesterase CpdA
MIQINIIKTLIFLTVFYWNSATPDNNPKPPWCFIQLSDPQFGMYSNNEDFDKESGLYIQAVRKINEFRPDFVVITGDFVHDPESESQINEFKRITDQISPTIPVYMVPGNHDIGTVNDTNLKTYFKRYGKDRFSFEHKGSRFIGFNTTLIKAKIPSLEQEQFEWLESKFELNQESCHIILFCHYPFYINSVNEPESYTNINPEKRQKYLDLFETYGIDAIFSGHLHKNIENKYKDIQVIITSAVGKPLGDDPSGMRVVTVYPDRIDHAYYGLDEFPTICIEE